MRRTTLIGTLSLFLTLSFAVTIYANQGSPQLSGDVPPKWTYTLPSKSCPDGSNNCSISSPSLVDLNNDGKLDVVVGTNNGHIVAIRHDGTKLWDFDTASAFNMAPGTHEIASSPSIADIDKDGYHEIVVGTGTTYNNVCTQGGIIVLEHDGRVKSGWPKLSYETTGDGCRETIYSSPALGDLTNDGYMEIVAGGFDKRIYAWRQDGSFLPGFPASSYHDQRFPDWGLHDKLADTIWSSPTLSDLNGDGHLDILIGTDEGNFDARWGGNANGWSCPYELPPGWTEGYCGGGLYALDHTGNLLPGFPRFFYEIVQSTPAVADVNGDGKPEIFVGSGSFYYQNSPDHPQHGFRLFAMDAKGNDLPGWSGGKAVDGTTSSSPVIGDITGDGKPEIVVGTKSHSLYAWNVSGQVVSGFPMKPIDRFGNGYPYASSFVLADYTGNGKMEIILNMASTLAVIDGTGKQLTRQGNSSWMPDFRLFGATRNTPAVADLDGNGKLEIVAHNSVVYVWEIPDSGQNVAWPMFKHNPARTSTNVAGYLNASPSAITQMTSSGGGNTLSIPLKISYTSNNGAALHWEASASKPNQVQLSQTSGSTNGQVNLTINIPKNSLKVGHNDLGTITVTGELADGAALGRNPTVIPVSVYLFNGVEQAFMPMINASP